MIALEQPVFVELEATPGGDAAQCDVVRLRAGKIHQCGAVIGFRNNAQIDLDAVLQHNRGAGRPARDDLRDILIADEALDDPGARRCGNDDVEIADGFPAPAIAAGDRGMPDAVRILQIVQQRLGDVSRRPGV